jgi:hypothetical protein
MGAGFDKQPASRPNIYQNMSNAGGASPSTTIYSSKFSAGTQHIRVISTIAGWCSIDQSTVAASTSALSATVGSTNIPATGMAIPASTVGGEYFIVTPGQLFTFASTSTSSGYVSITEMA